MISQEDFKAILEKVSNNEQPTLEEVNELTTLIIALDTNVMILQNALELSVSNAAEVIPAVAEQILRYSGRNDTKIKKKAAKFAAEMTARFEMVLQMYLAQAYENTQKILNGEEVEVLDTEKGDESNE